MFHDFSDILYTASITADDSEIENYGCIAEQLWAQGAGLA